MNDSISAMLETMLHVYINSKRQSGRTTRMISSLDDGDTIVCTNSAHARILQMQIQQEHGKIVRCIAAAPHRIEQYIDTLRGLPGNVVFDHTWIEDYYQHQIECASLHLQQIHKNINPEKPEYELTWDSFRSAN